MTDILAAPATCPACGHTSRAVHVCTCTHEATRHRLDLPSNRCAVDGCGCKRMELA